MQKSTHSGVTGGGRGAGGRMLPQRLLTGKFLQTVPGKERQGKKKENGAEKKENRKREGE